MHRRFPSHLIANLRHTLHKRISPVYKNASFIGITTSTVTMKPNAAQMSSTTKVQGQVTIRIASTTGQVTERSISRSYPNAKATKLMSELERLLSRTSTAEHTKRVSVRRNERRWTLLSGGNGIFATLIVPSSKYGQFVEAIETAANDLGHDPHLSRLWNAEDDAWVLGVLCTTHQPPGLSLKDTKLADRIDKLIRNNGTVEYVSDDGKLDGIVDSLLAKNIEAVDHALANPSSKCALHVKEIDHR